jgi:hypothetical protein
MERAVRKWGAKILKNIKRRIKLMRTTASGI